MQTARQTAFKITPTVRVELEQIIDHWIKDVHVTKEDFSELKAIVKDIVAIQIRTGWCILNWRVKRSIFLQKAAEMEGMIASVMYSVKYGENDYARIY